MQRLVPGQINVFRHEAAAEALPPIRKVHEHAATSSPSVKPHAGRQLGGKEKLIDNASRYAGFGCAEIGGQVRQVESSNWYDPARIPRI